MKLTKLESGEMTITLSKEETSYLERGFPIVNTVMLSTGSFEYIVERKDKHPTWLTKYQLRQLYQSKGDMTVDFAIADAKKNPYTAELQMLEIFDLQQFVKLAKDNGNTLISVLCKEA